MKRSNPEHGDQDRQPGCGDIRVLLPEHAENRLSAEQRAAVDHHLQSCPLCQIELHELASTLDILRSRRLDEPGEAFWQQMRQQVAEELSGDIRRRSWLRAPSLGVWAPAAAALLLVIAIFFAWGRQGTLPAEDDQRSLAQLQVEGRADLRQLAISLDAAEGLPLDGEAEETLVALLAESPDSDDRLARLMLSGDGNDNRGRWVELVELELAERTKTEDLIAELTAEQLARLSARLRDQMG